MKKIKIKIPEPVVLTGLNGMPVLDSENQPMIITFKNFVMNTLLIDNKFGKSMADILSAVEIKNKLSCSDEELELDFNDWERLSNVAKEPSAGYNPAVVVQIVAFLTAITEAK